VNDPQRQARELIHGADGPVVVITGRVAAWMLRFAGLEQYHAEHRGQDPEIDQALIAMKVVALSWRTSATGTRNAAAPELDAQSVWLSTKQAADALAMTDRAIRKAIRENRLKATTVGRAYRINREQLAHFKARKGNR
jgi:excisionase family DNA binding protein